MARKQLSEQAELAICLLGKWGFQGHCICEYIYRIYGEAYTTGYIYSILRANNVQLTAFRKGSTAESQEKIKEILHVKSIRKLDYELAIENKRKARKKARIKRLQKV
jgi:hypothetical protein